MDTVVDLDLWTLSTDERGFVATKNVANRLDVALLLKCFQQDGRFATSASTLDGEIVSHVAQQLNVAANRIGTIADRTLRRVRSDIRMFCGYREASDADRERLTVWVRDHAVAQSRNHARLAESLENECRRSRIEIPTAERADRLIRSAVRAYEERFYGETMGRLSPLTRARLDALLQGAEGDETAAREEASSRAVINTLREDAGRAGVNSIRDEMEKLDVIRKLELPAHLFDHALPHELEMYRQRVAVEAPYELRRHPEPARLTWLAAFAHLRGRAITDTLTDLLIETIHRINAKADRRVSKALIDDIKRVTGKTNILFHLADATLAQPDGVVRDVVFPVVGESTLRALVKEWKATGPAFRNTLRGFIRNSYKSHYRQMVPELLETLDFRSNNEVHRPVIRALEVIKQYAGTKLHNFPVDENVPLDFVPPLWRDAVVEDEVDGRPRINRITYEIAALNALRDQVRCKEIHVAGADRYRDPDDDVPTDFEAQRSVYYAALGLPSDPDVFIAKLRDEMRSELQTFNDGLGRNDAVTISSKAGGWIGLSPLEAQPEPQNVAALKSEVGERWPMTSLLDMLKEADLRLNFTDALRSVTSHENLEREVLRPRLLLCLHGIGTNTGLQRMNALAHGATYKDLVYARRRYITVDQLRNAIAIIADGTLRARNPEIWGDGTTACASNSKHFGAWDQNLTTQWHMRYGGPGIMIYWHVERKSLCIHSQLKSPSSSEVASMIEGVIHHITEMEIDRQYVDSHGQSEVAFAFCRLLGFALLPRLKAIHSQRLYRADAVKAGGYKRLEPVLTRPIDWELIRREYDQMIKYATALRLGTAQTESILRRFTRTNVQHPTYKAFAELGKAVKTAFLCRYLRTEALRREINEGLNVIEQWNGANDFVFFAKRGDLASNRHEDHEVSMLSLHLLQNCLVYINTLMLQQVLKQPHWAKRLTAVDLRAITPLIWEHVNPYGRFELDMETRLPLG